MLHAWDQKFDVTRNIENFCELNKACTPSPNKASLHCIGVVIDT